MVRSQHQRMSGCLGEEELADTAQEALTAIWSKLATFQGRSRLETWAFGFCMNELLKSIERTQRRLDRQVTLVRDVPQDGSEREPALDTERLHRGLARIGPPGSEVVRLKHFHLLTFAEIAAAMSIPENTAKSHYYRSLEKLRQLLVSAEEGDR